MSRDVVSAEVIGSTEIRLRFNDGSECELDIAAFVPFDGVFADLSDPAFFRRVRVDPELGTIVWPSGADLCPDVLHEWGTRAAGT